MLVQTCQSKKRDQPKRKTEKQSKNLSLLVKGASERQHHVVNVTLRQHQKALLAARCNNLVFRLIEKKTLRKKKKNGLFLIVAGRRIEILKTRQLT